MTTNLNRIVSNAQNGEGPCSGCPAHKDTGGEFVNPGLLNYDADVMVLTMDPSHYIDWDTYDCWTDYNDEKAVRFKEDWRGGTAIQKILSGVPDLSIDDIWLGDAVKCPVDNDRAGTVNTSKAFEHCSTYLEQEITDVDPQVIVTMGNNPAEQLLDGIFDQDVGAIKTGTQDCGKIYRMEPPVVVSPHWSNGWLGRHNNREKVQNAIRDVLNR